MADQYIYEPLSYRHEYCEPIRLLRVLPGKPGSMICCELFKTYLSTAESLQKWEEQYNGTHQHSSKASQNEEYYALSYEHSQIFWIDAICIDQTNLDERSRQVAFIADIYKEANTVLVWLEEEVAASPTAFTALSRPYDKHMLASEAEAIFEYFLAGYWDRLWVVQELYHARRIILRSGSLQLDWASISHTMIPGGLGKAYEIERHRERRRSCGSLTLSHMEANQAIEILETYGSRECLDPRDSVYGLRSLSPLFMSVVPDYSLSTAEVFTAATQAIISNFWSTYLLEVLEHVVRKKPSSRNVGPAGHLPSWVPDWTMPRTGSLHWLQAMPILASHKQKSTVLLSHDNPGVLPLCGIFVDTVTQVTRPYGEHAQPREGYTVVETVEQLQRWLPELTI
ncbi:hypothetical protein N431DRAFT_450765 [Stipitochalara longipes BDJ]|nr:hypothetical protein N431DRAFT_450765 [Stipitochalara longipes BDJ]